MRKTILQVLMALTVLSIILSACAPQAAATEEVGGFQIPATVDGKVNVAMVLIGPHDDGGWSQAHYDGADEPCRPGDKDPHQADSMGSVGQSGRPGEG